MCFIPFRFVKPTLAFATLVLLLNGIGMLVIAGLAAHNAFYKYTGLARPMLGVCIVIGLVMICFSGLLLSGLKHQRPGRICLGLIFIFFCIIGIIALIGVVFTVRDNYAPIYDPQIPLTCQQQYSKLSDLIQAYSSSRNIFCTTDCPCDYTGQYDTFNITFARGGPTQVQGCQSFKILPSLHHAAHFLSKIQSQFGCSSICNTGLFPIYYFSNVNAQFGPVKLSCDGKIRLYIIETAQIFGGMLVGMMIISLGCFGLVLSIFWHPQRRNLAQPPQFNRQRTRIDNQSLAEQQITLSRM